MLYIHDFSEVDEDQRMLYIHDLEDTINDLYRDFKLSQLSGMIVTPDNIKHVLLEHLAPFRAKFVWQRRAKIFKDISRYRFGTPASTTIGECV
jgi:hypothetical protein